MSQLIEKVERELIHIGHNQGNEQILKGRRAIFKLTCKVMSASPLVNSSIL